jgi:TM2 domain-containing membrane protein YozV
MTDPTPVTPGQPSPQGMQPPVYNSEGGQQNQQFQQPGYNTYQSPTPAKRGFGSVKKEKWVAGLFAIFSPLGALGVHKFYLGYKNEATIMLVVTIVGAVCTLGLGSLVMYIIALVEGVKYLSMSQEDFETTYVNGHKPWF